MDVAIIDAGGANLGSVRYALERLGAAPRIVRDADGLTGASHVVLPGVGAAAPAMAALRAQGLETALRALASPPPGAAAVPLLGICLGMQLLFEHSEEGDVACLGLLPGVVARMRPSPGIRVPHMGWNRLEPLRGSRLLAGLDAGAWAYFVHGYAAPVGDACVAACTHGGRFAAVVEHGHVGGAQFHPERSASTGAALLRNFLAVAA